MNATVELQVDGVTVPGKVLYAKNGNTISGTAILQLDPEQEIKILVTSVDGVSLELVGGSCSVDIHQLRRN